MGTPDNTYNDEDRCDNCGIIAEYRIAFKSHSVTICVRSLVQILNNMPFTHSYNVSMIKTGSHPNEAY